MHIAFAPGLAAGQDQSPVLAGGAMQRPADALRGTRSSFQATAHIDDCAAAWRCLSRLAGLEQSVGAVDPGRGPHGRRPNAEKMVSASVACASVYPRPNRT